MGKKSSGTSYTSKGERPNLARKTKNAMRRDYLEKSSTWTIEQSDQSMEEDEERYVNCS